MVKKSSKAHFPRVPAAAGGIQVNFCKNPACNNYGVPAIQAAVWGRGQPAPDDYRIYGAQAYKLLHCKACNEYPPIKSNQAVLEELARMIAAITPWPKASCGTPGCGNASVPVSSGPENYQAFGTTRSGSKRYRCKLCKKTLSVGGATLRQKKPHKNKRIFTLLLSKTPFRRICWAEHIGPGTLYAKIDFFYRQCLAFAASKEQTLAAGKQLDRLYLSCDRQDYYFNWEEQRDKRNIVLRALGSADNRTSYVLGLHLDYDPDLDAAAIERDAVATGDYALPPAYRKYARLWLQRDYVDFAIRNRLGRGAAVGDELRAKIEEQYANTLDRADVETDPTQTLDTKLPGRGMQVHSEYTLYGHFYYLRYLLPGVKKLRFFLDQESGIRAACLAAFADRVKAREVDAFYVRIAKDMTVNEKRRLVGDVAKQLETARSRYPGLTDKELEINVIKERLKKMANIGKWQDRWLYHPFPDMGEPRKAVCCLTDYGDYDEEHLAKLYGMASLHAIDRFFMQVRRFLSLLERPIQTSSNARRVWYGYGGYNPEMAVKLLTIFRTCYNYVLVGGDGKTPAQRLGLARAPVTLERIIYFQP